jgi:hypothetical protein
MIIETALALKILGGLCATGAILITRNFWIGLYRDVILPGIKRVAWYAAEAIVTLIDIVEGTVTYTAKAIKRAIENFKDNVLGVEATYQNVSESKVSVTTEAYVMDGEQLVKATSRNVVDNNEIPDYIREKLKARQTVKVDHADDLINLAQQKVAA